MCTAVQFPSSITTASPYKFRVEDELSELFEQIRHLNYNQSQLRNSQPVPQLLINSAGNEEENDERVGSARV